MNSSVHSAIRLQNFLRSQLWRFGSFVAHRRLPLTSTALPLTALPLIAGRLPLAKHHGGGLSGSVVGLGGSVAREIFTKAGRSVVARWLFIFILFFGFFVPADPEYYARWYHFGGQSPISCVFCAVFLCKLWSVISDLWSNRVPIDVWSRWGVCSNSRAPSLDFLVGGVTHDFLFFFVELFFDKNNRKKKKGGG